jgi:hypothetical protein
MLLNEMSAEVKRALLSGEPQRFEAALIGDYGKLETQLKHPPKTSYAVQNASNFVTNREEGDKWMSLRFDVEVDGEIKHVKVGVPNEEISNIKNYVFTVNGKEVKFKTTTNIPGKQTGNIESAISYMLYGVHKAVYGDKKRGGNKVDKITDSIKDMSKEELRKLKQQIEELEEEDSENTSEE